MPTSQMWSYM
ncbi:hypothetical protein F383_26786 [Gossypium arboreum]|uniref:Uncharacterized protein n=1 Tax=Gossypium arboreum TaxID=29729 RepID=A0A0B0MIF7_GOSAR|nr:hypothetical protein F383_37916 [Gossypium arboreum]KHG22478.1 hypothetical protein F383_26786 [Gossypium arboreum]